MQTHCDIGLNHTSKDMQGIVSPQYNSIDWKLCRWRYTSRVWKSYCVIRTIIWSFSLEVRCMNKCTDCRMLEPNCEEPLFWGILKVRTEESTRYITSSSLGAFRSGNVSFDLTSHLLDINISPRGTNLSYKSHPQFTANINTEYSERKEQFYTKYFNDVPTINVACEPVLYPWVNNEHCKCMWDQSTVSDGLLSANISSN